DHARDATVQDVATDAAGYGLPTGMTEHIGADYLELHRLLTLSNLSLFQQYTAAYAASVDNGEAYYILDVTNPTAPTVTMASRTKFLRQYFKYIRRGAVRIGAASTNASFDPVAFINAGGQYVVV